jgi:hypothetical protein
MKLMYFIVAHVIDDDQRYGPYDCKCPISFTLSGRACSAHSSKKAAFESIQQAWDFLNVVGCRDGLSYQVCAMGEMGKNPTTKPVPKCENHENK